MTGNSRLHICFPQVLMLEPLLVDSSHKLNNVWFIQTNRKLLLMLTKTPKNGNMNSRLCIDRFQPVVTIITMPMSTDNKTTILPQMTWAKDHLIIRYLFRHTSARWPNSGYTRNIKPRKANMQSCARVTNCPNQYLSCIAKISTKMPQTKITIEAVWNMIRALSGLELKVCRLTILEAAPEFILVWFWRPNVRVLRTDFEHI